MSAEPAICVFCCHFSQSCTNSDSVYNADDVLDGDRTLSKRQEMLRGTGHTNTGAAENHISINFYLSVARLTAFAQLVRPRNGSGNVYDSIQSKIWDISKPSDIQEPDSVSPPTRRTLTLFVSIHLCVLCVFRVRKFSTTRDTKETEFCTLSPRKKTQYETRNDRQLSAVGRVPDRCP